MTDDRPIWVTIPTIGHSELLLPLLRSLEEDRAVQKIILTVNLEEYVEPIRNFFHDEYSRIEVVETWGLGKSLHHGWNTAITMAREANAWLAVLNDDLRLLESDAISNVAWLLERNSEYAVIGLNWLETPESTSRDALPVGQVHGSYRHHGVGGFAWVCDPHKVVLVPEDLIWWYGDDHIFLSAEREGHKLGIASHVHVEHANSLTANSGEHNWALEAISSDHAAFQRLWPGK